MRLIAMMALTLGIVLAATTSLPNQSHAQGTGRSLDIDLSIRSNGMGKASNALFWGSDLNHWGNPALLGYVRGVGFEMGRRSLVPGLANDVILWSTVIKVGGGGLGVVLSGKPFGVGGARLDYGESEGTDESGQPTGTYKSFEEIDSWGFGVNAFELLETVIRASGASVPHVSRFVDVSGGMNFKDVEIKLGPIPGGTGTTTASDWGFLVRATPLDLNRDGGGTAVRAEVAYGWSELSQEEDALVTFLNEDQASPLTNHRRKGFSAHVAESPAQWPPAGWSEGAWRFFLDESSPLVSLGMTVDDADVGPIRGGTSSETSGWGVEVTLADVIALRTGHYEDKLGDVDGATWGWSARVLLGRLGRLYYQEGRFPPARNSDLDNSVHRALSLWIDPIRIWRLFRHDG